MCMYVYIYDYVCMHIWLYVFGWSVRDPAKSDLWRVTNHFCILFLSLQTSQSHPTDTHQAGTPASMVVGDVPRLLRCCFQRCFHLGNPCVWRAAPPVRGRYSLHHRCWRRGRQRSCSVAPRYLNRFSKPSRSVGTIEWCRDWGSGLFRSCRQHGFTWGLETDRYWLFMYTVYMCIYIYTYIRI